MTCHHPLNGGSRITWTVGAASRPRSRPLSSGAGVDSASTHTRWSHSVASRRPRSAQSRCVLTTSRELNCHFVDSKIPDSPPDPVPQSSVRGKRQGAGIVLRLCALKARVWRYPISLKPCILRLGLFQDGNVGIRVFPERQEVLVSGLCFLGVALENIGTSKTETSEHS